MQPLQLSDRVVRNAAFISLLCTASPAQRRALIETASKDQIDTLCEIALNTRDGNIDASPEQIKALRRHRDRVIFLADKRVPWTEKKEDLEQSGGFLPILAAVLAPVIGGALGAVTDHYVRKAMN